MRAPAAWREIDFISDLHLQESDPATFDAWRQFMRATTADAVFILGDLFEAWVGDDGAAGPGFASECAAVLKAATARLAVFFMRGNRDFLVGEGLMRATGATLLEDPTVLDFMQQRWLLSHGDALCLSDTDYMRFRAQVRAPAWQQAFLAKPLSERQAIARGMRDESEARKRSGAQYADLDEAAVTVWLDLAGADTMIHGHTHKPHDHELAKGRRRIVMSDWDARALPARLEVLRLGASGPQRIALS